MTLLPQVIEARYVSGYCIELRFNTGVTKTVNFSHWLTGPVFKPLTNKAEFRKFFIAGGTICWPNGADIAPETLLSVRGVTQRAAWSYFMKRVRFTHWRVGKFYIGVLNQYPDYRTQGKSKRELTDSLKDLLLDIESREVPYSRKLPGDATKQNKARRERVRKAREVATAWNAFNDKFGAFADAHSTL